MSDIQSHTQSLVVPVQSSRTIQVKNINVELKEGRWKHSVAILFRWGEDNEEQSPWFKRGEEILWKFNKQLPFRTQATIYVRERHVVRGDKDIAVVSVSTDELSMTPFFLFEEEQKVTLKIECESSGAFVDLIRRLVEESQKRLGNMKVFMERLSRICEALNFLVNITDPIADVHPAAQATLSAVNLLCDLCEKLHECQEAASDLMRDMASFLPFTEFPVGRLKSDVTERTVRDMLHLFERITRAIIKYSSDNTLGGLLVINDRIDEIHSYKEEFVKLKEILNWSVTAETWRTVLNIEDHTEDTVLTRLGPVMDAYYRRDQTCFAGSRKETLRIIECWSASESSPKLFWLYGFPSSGKTTIAHTLAEIFDRENRLAGCFFCSKGDVERCNPEKVIPTIAYQLAKWHKTYRSVIVGMLHGLGELELRTGLESQYKRLVERPLAGLSVHLPPKHKPLVIVLDALDECCDSAESRSLFLSYIRRTANAVPWLKVFVSSREIPEIETGLRWEEFQSLDIGDPHHISQDDIAAYVEYLIENQDQSSALRENLEYEASGLFRRICRELGSPPEIQSTAFSVSCYVGEKSQLDAFFWMILGVIFVEDQLNNRSFSVARDVLVVLTCISLHELPTEELLLHLLKPFQPDLDTHSVRTFICTLSPLVFQGSTPTFELLLPPLPFLSFISDRERSQYLWVCLETVNARLAEQCLETLRSELRFNICDLESSYLKNDDVPDLERRIKANVPARLRYSTLHWMDHVSQAGSNQTLREWVLDFLYSRRILYWIELSCLMGALEECKHTLQKCATFFKEIDQIVHVAEHLHELISDFSGVVNTSTPHLYISALSWIPTYSLPSSVCPSEPWTQPLYPCREDESEHVQACPLVAYLDTVQRLDRVADSIRHSAVIAVSPDNSRIASLSTGGIMEVFDIQSRKSVSWQLENHGDTIYAIKFSSDGTKVMVKSCRKEEIWDAQTGALVPEPVIPSDDDASYPGDRGIRRAEKGMHIFARKADKLRSEYDCIAACREENTSINSMDTFDPLNKTRGEAGDEAHPVQMCEVVLPHFSTKSRSQQQRSSDGNRIVSGHIDGTITLRDAQDGSLMCSPLVGHSGAVENVAYSADGSRIISGSQDKTLRIWDASDGVPIGVIPRDESRWDPDEKYFLSVMACWFESLPPTMETLVHSDAPLYIPDDGWLRTLDGSLFIWVPPKYRFDICRHGLKGEIDPCMKFNCKNVRHGRDWTKIMNENGTWNDP